HPFRKEREKDGARARWLGRRSLGAGGCWNRRGGGRSGRRGGRRSGRLADQYGKARKRETAGGVVDHIQLAEILAGLEPAERDIELETHSVAAFDVDGSGLHDWCLVYLCGSLNHFQATQQIDAWLRSFGIVRGGFGARGIVDLIEQVKVLVLAEDVADVGHILLAVAHQRVDFRPGLLAWGPLRGQQN